jgi:dipeptidyl-peptidase 4
MSEPAMSEPAMSEPTDTFPRQYARTQRLTLGEPRTITVSPDGHRAVFLRSRAGDDPTTCLWTVDLDPESPTRGVERLVADPLALLSDPNADADLPPEERARRERMREGAGGVTAYATDRAVAVAAFTIGGRLFAAGLVSAAARELAVDGPVFDPTPDPLARRIAYVSGRTLRIAELDPSSWELAGEPDDAVSWGSADFIAAEEMHRFRGYWWNPDGSAIAATRVDVSPVQTWFIADPANPEQRPTEVRYPAAGTANADVSLHVLALDGGSVEVSWDRAAFPYLATVSWIDTGRLLLSVQSRDQRTLDILEADATTGATRSLHTDSDPAWVELVPGSPAVLDDGRLVTVEDRDDHRCVVIIASDGEHVISPDDVQVRALAHVGATITFTGNPLDDPTVLHVYDWTPDGGAVQRTADPGVHGVSNGRPDVVRTARLDTIGSTTSAGDVVIASHAETPLVAPNVTIHRVGERRLATAVLLPHDLEPGAKLPVLLDPYGGPHAQRVLAANSAYLSAQWFADQGFAVVVCDGRGTPGRGTSWERAVHRDLATPVLDDQIDALHAAAELHPELDLERVAIRGWSFGGYLAALAVLRRPDVFHAAIAGAPVTEWRLYDTHYTERYLGDPSVDASAYAATSLLPLAHDLTRPLLLVHGLADDNVVAAHSLQLSSALLAAGKPHELLALVGVSHMTPQEVVAENLLLHQLDFLRRALARA